MFQVETNKIVTEMPPRDDSYDFMKRVTQMGAVSIDTIPAKPWK